MDRIDRYTCEQVFRRLDDYLDGRLPPDEVERIDEHLALCQVCVAEYRFEGDLLEALRQKLRSVSLPSGLRTKIAKVLEQARAEVQRDLGADDGRS